MTHKGSNATDRVCPPDQPVETPSGMDMDAAYSYNYADIYQIVESIKKMQKNDRKKSRKRKRKEVHS